MRIMQVVRCRRVRVAAVFVCTMMAAATAARAEVTLAEAKGFRFFTDGRINTFASVGFGDDFPPSTPNPGGPSHAVIGNSSRNAHGQITDQADADNKYFAIRGRNGFLATVLGLGMRSKLGESTNIKGYLSLWGHAETYNRDRSSSPAQLTYDVREGYVAFDGPWGALTAGRQLGLFGRMSTDIDFNYGHNYGLGYPCGDRQGPTCGHIGTGVMFPGFGAGFQYSTPSLGGLQLHVGLYDPVRLLGAWDRASLPRPEAAISFEQKFANKGLLKFQVEGLWQEISRLEALSTTPPTSVVHRKSVWGVAGGGRFELGPVRLGAAAFHGKGLGQFYALQNSPAVFNSATLDVRTFTGVYGQGALVFGPLQVSAGAGRVIVGQLAEDKVDLNTSNAKGQYGLSFATYYRISEGFVLGLDYFRFSADWYGAPRSTTDPSTMQPLLQPGFLAGEQQVVSYINAGATFQW